MEYRLIVTSSENGEQEAVRFCDADDVTPAADFCVRGHTSIRFDGIIEADLPSGFPLNYDLKRTP